MAFPTDAPTAAQHAVASAQGELSVLVIDSEAASAQAIAQQLRAQGFARSGGCAGMRASRGRPKARTP